MGFSITARDHVVGVDLGGSNVRAVLADRDGTPVAELADATAARDARAVVAQIADVCRRLVDGVGLDWSRVAAAGVGVPGVANGGSLRMAPNLPPFDEVDLAEALGEELRVTLALDNDLNMATVGEHRRGLGVDRADFVFIGVGTGIGMGIVAGGRLLSGATGAAGEIAELPLDGGQLEQIAGGAGLPRRYAERGGRRTVATALDVYAAAEAGDREALAVLDLQARAVALGVVAVQSVLDPELVVFGGGIGSRADFVARVRASLVQLTDRTIRTEASALGERAGAIGAAEVARDRATEAIDV